MQPPLPGLPTLQRPLPFQDEAAAPGFLSTRLGCLGDGCTGEPRNLPPIMIDRGLNGELVGHMKKDLSGKPPWLLCSQTMLQVMSGLFFAPNQPSWPPGTF